MAAVALSAPRQAPTCRAAALRARARVPLRAAAASACRRPGGAAVRAAQCDADGRSAEAPPRRTPAAPRAPLLAAAAALPSLHALAAHAATGELAALAEGSAFSAPKTIVSALLVFFIIAQGPKGEGMINSMNESRMFGNFSETKNFVSVGTWALVGAFLLLSALAALKH